MRIAINHGTQAAARVAREMPLGAETKREVATLKRNLEDAREHLRRHDGSLMLMHNRLSTLESMPKVLSKGEPGEKGEQGPPGETRIVVIQPEYKTGAWFRFWRRWLLGING